MKGKIVEFDDKTSCKTFILTTDKVWG